jgi:hypothetical protein
VRQEAQTTCGVDGRATRPLPPALSVDRADAVRLSGRLVADRCTAPERQDTDGVQGAFRFLRNKHRPLPLASGAFIPMGRGAPAARLHCARLRPDREGSNTRAGTVERLVQRTTGGPTDRPDVSGRQSGA